MLAFSYTIYRGTASLDLDVRDGHLQGAGGGSYTNGASVLNGASDDSLTQSLSQSLDHSLSSGEGGYSLLGGETSFS